MGASKRAATSGNPPSLPWRTARFMFAIAQSPAARRPRTYLISVIGVALVVASLALVSNVSADPAPGPGALSQTTAGSLSAGIVPDGTCAARVTAVGGGGASSPVSAGFGGTGGAGASITATIDVLPGQSYGGSVGGGGGLPAGGSGDGALGFGGTGGTIVDSHRGGGGGGRSSVSLGGATVLVAGGGGGGGAAHDPAPAGVGGGGGFAGIAPGVVATGQDGQPGVESPGAANGGQGGQAAAGGAGGTNTTDGTLSGAAGGGIGVGTGGNGGPDPNFDSAGGGGGGYTGGGGGASGLASTVTGAGGGGGSSWVAATSPTTVGAAPTGVTGAAGTASPAGSGPGATGSISIDWLPCVYGLSVDKAVSAASVNAGGSVVWTVSVTNVGPDAMTLGDTVDLTDLLPGPTPTFEILSFSVSGGSNDELARGPVTCTGVTVGASMPTSTTCSRAYSAPGAPEAPSGGLRGLDVDETITITYEQIIANDAACGTITNTASVNDRASTTGTTDVVGVIAERSDDASLAIACYDLAITKEASPTPVRADRDITWTVTVTNDGSADMEGPDATDPNPLVVTDLFPSTNVGGATLTSSTGPAGSCALAAGTITCDAGLPADGVQVLTFRQTVAPDAPIGAVISNTASVSDPTTGDDNDSATAETTVGVPLLAMTKTADPLSYDAANDVISYEYVVTNAGTVDLAGPVTVSDDRATVTCPVIATLAPTASVTCTASYAITQADVDAGSVTNTATASADDVTSPPDSATVTATQGPAIVLVKSADVAAYDAVDDVVNYTYVITNTGNVTLTGPFEVADDRTDDETCPAVGTLAPGDSITCTSSYEITQGDLDAGSLTNVASATNGDITSNEDTVTITAVARPELALMKRALADALPAAGSVVEYEYEVTNTGNVSLDGPVAVSDDKTSVACPDLTTVGDLDASLDPGETVTCTSSYTVTAADVTAGRVTNVAAATVDGVASGVESATVTRTLLPDTRMDGVGETTSGRSPWPALVAVAVLAGLVVLRRAQARRA